MTGSNHGRALGDYISLSPNAAAHVVAYFVYCTIVGDDDDDEGKLFSLEKYEVYKRRLLPMITIVLGRTTCCHLTGYATPYKAMGGLTGFSSLAEGYLRLDPSGSR
ncbi:unnamed protein product [Adineta steineri]|uniref:Uncharacterized protein n=1 Tax=Adineta steineri TaxID=433720 RepID=A0A818V7H4_9BILA|nr:unnamed protein product [Adineta steineri]CAF3702957.1 unnamed protein product [Adineta steineri]